MGIAERKKKARLDMRGLILSTAERLFVREGYEKVTMRRIAQAMEYSPTTIYRHFKDKADLLFHLLEGYHGALRIRMEKVYDGAPNAMEAVRAGMRAYAEFGLANPSYYKLAFNCPPEFDAQSYLADGEEGTLLFKGHRAMVERCIREGLFRQMGVDLAAQTVWMLNHGVTSLLLSNPNFPWKSRTELIESVIDCAIAGLRSMNGAAR